MSFNDNPKIDYFNTCNEFNDLDHNKTDFENMYYNDQDIFDVLNLKKNIELVLNKEIQENIVNNQQSISMPIKEELKNNTLEKKLSNQSLKMKKQSINSFKPKEDEELIMNQKNKFSSSLESCKLSLNSDVKICENSFDIKTRYERNPINNFVNKISKNKKIKCISDIRKEFLQVNYCCSCKNSYCLKLYCECFKNNKYCVSCPCSSCMNDVKFDVLRQHSIQHIKSKNRMAFKNIPNTEDNSNQTEKGCKCKFSKCKKKYCECYEKGNLCSVRCKCENCLNMKK